jgi:hypothetical protein
MRVFLFSMAAVGLASLMLASVVAYAILAPTTPQTKTKALVVGWSALN